MKKIALAVLSLMIVTASAFAQEKKETVKIYNPSADARADLNAAVKKAKKEGKHVFVQIGGNWCVWCIAFHAMVDSTPALKKELHDNYEVVLVNYSPENKNEAVLASLKYPQRFGFPVFLVLDGDGKLLHTQNSAYLETQERDANGKKKTGHDVKEVTNFLKAWTTKAVAPSTYKTSK
ncbi:MAG: thioredoxin family protein [Pedobacter sp.]|nr:MAG: thioredoxin family protein [Pedobacter sp.]